MNPIDPEIAQFARELQAGWAAAGFSGSLAPPEARAIAERVRAPWARGGPRIAAVTEQIVYTSSGSVRVRLYDPEQGSVKPTLIYLHGGGWTLFSLDTHDRVMREYASRAAINVLGVDYALAPEHKYPAALEQVVAVARHVWMHGRRFGADPEAIAIGGDSAGANLAIAACLRLRHESQPALIRAMILNYGVFARHSSEQAIARYGGSETMLTAEEMEGFWRNYLRCEADAEDPLVCPIEADLRGLPPAFLVVPECDLLAEQSMRLGELLREAGVPVDVAFYRGATHSFLEAVSIAPIAGRAFAETADWLRRILVSEHS
ncbi:MAG: alpha/beta hydrolase [Acidobacteriota bacterium]